VAGDEMQELTVETEHIRNRLPQRETAFCTIVSSTGCASIGEVLITRRISEVAACCSCTSASFFSTHLLRKVRHQLDLLVAAARWPVVCQV
jgi:hypothetical protein